MSPSTTEDVFYADKPIKMAKSKHNFDLLNKLISKYKNLNFVISTGRSGIELQVIYDLYKRAGVDFVNAHSAIVKEGADEFIRDDNKKDDYPFVIQNKKRNQEISAETNWDKPVIQKDVINIVKDCGLDPIVCRTTLKPETYGGYSIFSYPEKITDKTVLLRDLGELKIFLGFVNEISDEKYKEVKEKLDEYFSENKIKCKPAEKQHNKECQNLRTITYIPIVKGEELSKNFDIKEKVKTMDNSDTLIVAGDAKNDYPMLNPDSYSKDFNGELISIIVKKNDQEEPELMKLKNDFKDTDLRKIIVIEEGELADTIEQAAIKKFGY
jgi:hypothetical protein